MLSDLDKERLLRDDPLTRMHAAMLPDDADDGKVKLKQHLLGRGRRAGDDLLLTEDAEDMDAEAVLNALSPEERVALAKEALKSSKKHKKRRSKGKGRKSRKDDKKRRKRRRRESSGSSSGSDSRSGSRSGGGCRNRSRSVDTRRDSREQRRSRSRSRGRERRRDRESRRDHRAKDGPADDKLEHAMRRVAELQAVLDRAHGGGGGGGDAAGCGHDPKSEKGSARRT